MTDHPITTLFEQLDDEPSQAFTDTLRARLVAELTTRPTAVATAPAPTAGATDEEAYVQTITPDETTTTATRKPRRPRWVVPVALAAGVAVVVGVAGTLALRKDTTTVTVSKPTKVGEWDDPAAGGWLLSDGTHAWIASDRTAQRLGPTGKPDGPTVQLASPAPSASDVTPTSLRVGKDLFVAGSPATLFDPATAKVVRTLGISGAAYATDGTRIWASQDGGRVVSVDATTGAAGPTITVPNVDQPVAALYAQGSLWLSYNAPSAAVVKVDPATGTVQATIPGFSFDMVEAAGSVWIANYDTGEAVRVDPASGAVQARVKVSAEKTWGLAPLGDEVWATSWSEGTVSVIDPTTNKVVATVGNLGDPTQIVAAGARAYTTATGIVYVVASR